MRYICLKTTLFFILLLLSCSATQVYIEEQECEEAEPVHEPFFAAIGRAVDPPGPLFFSEMDLPEDQSGFILYDTASGITISEHNFTRAFIPASTSKVPVAVFAFEFLGDEYRFKTSIYKTGEISDDGVLEGDIYLKGGADPYLDLSGLLALVDALRGAGIRNIEGNFYYDEGGFIPVPEIDASMQTYAPYNPGVSYLSVESNLVRAFWERRQGASRVEAFLVPDLPVNSIKISDNSLLSGAPFEFNREEGVEKWLLPRNTRGTGRASLPVKDPGRHTAYFFSRLCGIHGIETGEPQKGNLPDEAERIGYYLSEPLAVLIRRMLTDSDNLAAELMMLKAAEISAGRVLTLEEAGQEMKDFFIKEIDGVDWSEFSVARGSGLTSLNRMTPEQMLAVILYASDMRPGGRPFSRYLPAGGWQSSTERRFRGDSEVFRVYAKAGAINYALSLAGYIYTDKGNKLAFCIMVSDPEKRAGLEVAREAGLRSDTNITRHWMDLRRSAIDSVVTEWIKSH